jgi:PAS domain S-box-containing protein
MKDDVTLMSEGAFAACDKLSSERYRVFVENIEEGVYEVDIHGNFVYFNESLCRIFGYPREEIQFQNFSKFIHEEHVKEVAEAFRRIHDTGQGILDLVWKIRTPSGEVRMVEVSANLITNKEGEKIGFRGIARDVTERYRTIDALRKSQRRYRTLLDFVPYPMVVFTLDGRVSYLNPAFTEVFGWSLEELEGKPIPYVPAGMEADSNETIKKLIERGTIHRHETKRLTKSGKLLDVVMRATILPEEGEEEGGELVILRDITREKRIARNSEALFRISMALPEYTELEDLLDFISNEVKRLLNVEGALVILLDEEKKELFFKSGAHDDTAAELRIKEIRYPADKGVSGEVIRTGKPIIVHDTSKDPHFYSAVDQQAGFKTRALLDVPLRSKDRIIGVLCAVNKKSGPFDNTDVEFLSMIAGTVELSLENARFSEQLKTAYREVSSLNRAKDRVINHLSHELKTPLSVLGASLRILEKKLSALPSKDWVPTMERAVRNLGRVLDLQYQVQDIIQSSHAEVRKTLDLLLDECADLIEALAEEAGCGDVSGRIRQRIDELYERNEKAPQDVALDAFTAKTIEEIRPLFANRKLEIETHLESGPAIRIPIDPLRKVIVGLIRNAVENTPDEGRIEIGVMSRGNGMELTVRDYGVGITQENKKRIFEGFFTTRETMSYSSMRPFEFNAGGKGADLLRMKIFSERYNFKITMDSVRCPHIPTDADQCPGAISRCPYCNGPEDCRRSGGTIFTVFFPVGTERAGTEGVEEG